MNRSFQVRRRCRAPLCVVFIVLFAAWAAVGLQAGPMTVRFLTYNVNFNTSAANVGKDLDLLAPKADILMFQEAKNVKITSMLDANVWSVYQVTNSVPGKQGSALAVRNTVKAAVLNWGLQFGVDNHGEQMNDRYILWADLRLTNGQVLRVLSLHFPPARFEYLQPLMAANLVDFVNGSPYPVVAGADWNFPVNNDKWGIQNKTGLKPKGDGIDGFFYDASVVDFLSLEKLKNLATHNDHTAVLMIMVVRSSPAQILEWTVS